MYKEEFCQRIFILLAIILILFIYLYIFRFENLEKAKKIIGNFERLSLKKILILLFLISLLIFNFSLLFSLKNGLVYLGDEPHYLLISHSIIVDKDVNLRNNYLNIDYKRFYPGELGFHAHYGKKGENYWYSFHLPGLPFLLIPSYWLSLKFPFLINYLPRAFITAVISFSGLQFFLLLHQLGISKFNSFLVWLLCSFISPVLFFSFHIYPEPISLSLSFYLIRKFIFLNFKKLDWLFIPLSFFLFPWLGAKYILIASPIIVFGFYSSLKQKSSLKIVLFSLLSLLISYVIFLFFLYKWFGSFSTLSLYHGVLTKENISYIKDLIIYRIPLTMRIETFLGYLYDQRDGLLFYSPIYFFSFLGFLEMIKRKRTEAISLLLIAVPFLLNYSFLTHRGGASPQARPILPIFLIFPIFLSYFLEYGKGRFFRFLFFSSIIISIIFSVILLKNPLFLYQPTTHEVNERSGALFVYLSNFWFPLPSFLPSFIKPDTSYYLPNYIWTGLTVIFVLAYLFRRKIRTKIDFEISGIILLSILFSFYFVLFPRGYLHGSKKVVYNLKTKLSFHSIPENVEIEREKIVVNGRGKFIIPFTSFEKIDQIFISYEGIGKIIMGDQIILKKAILKNPSFVKFKDRYLYLLRILSEGRMEIKFLPSSEKRA